MKLVTDHQENKENRKWMKQLYESALPKEERAPFWFLTYLWIWMQSVVSSCSITSR